ncbi:Protein ZBED8 [Dictyocoela muelleri]|nr:Protein ZBED8 [Dictyocoela muelleri]
MIKFNCLLLHTEVRWLSKGSCYESFCYLYDSVIEFLEEKDLQLQLKLIDFKTDIAYLTDFFEKFNIMNRKLQGNDLNLIKAKSIISGFVGNILNYKQNFGRGKISQF